MKPTIEPAENSANPADCEGCDCCWAEPCRAGECGGGVVCQCHPGPERHPVFRTGRKVGRTVYVQTGTDPADSDTLIGVMDTPGLAAFAVEAMNAAVADGKTPVNLLAGWL